MNRLLWMLRNRNYLVDIRSLTVGGHCGCCGKWVGNAIVDKDWRWTLCDRCAGDKREAK
jgi:hypothetical protein